MVHSYKSFVAKIVLYLCRVDPGLDFPVVVECD